MSHPVLYSRIEYHEIGMPPRLYFHRLWGLSGRPIVNYCRKLRNFYCRWRPAPIYLSPNCPNYSQLWRASENYLKLGGKSNGMAEMIVKPKNVRVVFWILGILHVLTLAVAALICHGCPGELAVPAAIIGTASAVRFFWMFGSGIAQAATASTMLVQQRGNTVVDNAFRHQRRITYKRWLWWSRFGILVMALQVAGATYLAIVLIKKAMNGHNSSSCYPMSMNIYFRYDHS